MVKVKPLKVVPAKLNLPRWGLTSAVFTDVYLAASHGYEILG